MTTTPTTTLKDLSWEKKIQILRKHFETKGYRVHSGLQFGCELVLYADDPSRVHSDFCVHLVANETSLDWRNMQTLVRSMPELHKTLILASITAKVGREEEDCYVIQELAMTTEHAPFRHRNVKKQVGEQRKKQKLETDADKEKEGSPAEDQSVRPASASSADRV